MNIFLYFVAAFNMLGSLITIMSVGKDRKPTTPGVAAFSVAVSVALSAGIVYVATQI